MLNFKNKQYEVITVEAGSDHCMAAHVEDDFATFIYDVEEDKYTHAEDFFSEKSVHSLVAVEVL